MSIKNYITKDLVFGAIGGSILATIITSIIDSKAVNKSNKELELSNEELKKAAEILEKGNGLVATAAHQLKVSNNALKNSIEEREKLKDELKKYDDDEFKKWNQFRDEFSEFLKEKRNKEQKEKVEAEAKAAIVNKDWDEVYRLTERWYNHYPVQMSRSEVFTYLETNGYITKEERTEAYNYFGNLWNYVGD